MEQGGQWGGLGSGGVMMVGSGGGQEERHPERWQQQLHLGSRVGEVQPSQFAVHSRLFPTKNHTISTEEDSIWERKSR